MAGAPESILPLPSPLCPHTGHFCSVTFPTDESAALLCASPPSLISELAHPFYVLSSGVPLPRHLCAICVPLRKGHRGQCPGDLPGGGHRGLKRRNRAEGARGRTQGGAGAWGRTGKGAGLWEGHSEGQTSLSGCPSPRGGAAWKVRGHRRGCGPGKRTGSRAAGGAGAESVLATRPRPGVRGLGCLPDRVQEHGQPRLQHLSARSDLLSARRRRQRVAGFRCGRGRPRAAAPLPARCALPCPARRHGPSGPVAVAPARCPPPCHLLVPGAATRGAIAASPGRRASPGSRGRVGSGQSSGSRPRAILRNGTVRLSPSRQHDHGQGRPTRGDAHVQVEHPGVRRAHRARRAVPDEALLQPRGRHQGHRVRPHRPPAHLQEPLPGQTRHPGTPSADGPCRNPRAWWAGADPVSRLSDGASPSREQNTMWPSLTPVGQHVFLCCLFVSVFACLFSCRFSL